MRTRQTLWLLVCVFGANFARSALGPLQESMRYSLGLTDNQIAVLQGPVLAIPVVLMAVPLGLLIERVSRARLMVVLMGCVCSGSFATAWAHSYELLAAARGLVGLSGTAIFTVVLSILADRYPEAQRGRATTTVALSQLAGAASAFALGGTLLEASSTRGDLWRFAMAGLSAPLLLIMMASLAIREPARTHRESSKVTFRGEWQALWHLRRRIASLLGGLVVLELSLGASLVWAAPAFSRGYRLAPGRVGVLVASGLAVSGVVGPLLGGLVADFCQKAGGSKRVLWAASGVSAVAAVLSAYPCARTESASFPLFMAFMTVVSGGCVMATALFTTVVPREIRGLCLAGMTAACILVGVGAAPVFVSALANLFSGEASIARALALLGAAAGALGAAMFLNAGRHLTDERTMNPSSLSESSASQRQPGRME